MFAYLYICLSVLRSSPGAGRLVGGKTLKSSVGLLHIRIIRRIFSVIFVLHFDAKKPPQKQIE